MISGYISFLDPRLKIASFLALSLAIVFTPIQDIYKFLSHFLFLISLVFLSRISLLSLLKRLFPLFPLLTFIALSVFWQEKGNLHQKILPLLNIIVKTFLVFLALAIFILTTEFHRLLQGLGLLGMPKIVTTILSFAHRYYFLFVGEIERLRRGKESRSFGKKNKCREIKILVHLVSPMFFRTLERSERIYAAMLSRGYKGKIETINLLKFSKVDFIFCLFFSLFLTLIVVFL